MTNHDILSRYYDGILRQLQGEVDFINEVFEHQGLKGEGNETVIRNLVKKFIPNKYGVGSGIVIDKDGNVSRQSDIVIYDNHNYPEILSMSSIHMYPVDLVYATIEVKTTLSKSAAKDAIENIKSVRRLNYIKENFRKYPFDPVSEVKPDTTLWETQSTIPPIGIIFGYRSKTQSHRTFANWFRPSKDEDASHWPSHVFCLDQGLIVAPGWQEKRFCLIFPLIHGDTFYTSEGMKTKVINGKEWAEHSDRFYPATKANEDQILVDQGKSLLQFVLLLTELLAKKNLSPNINFRQNYLSSDMVTTFEIPDKKGKPIVHRK